MFFISFFNSVCNRVKLLGLDDKEIKTFIWQNKLKLEKLIQCRDGRVSQNGSCSDISIVHELHASTSHDKLLVSTYFVLSYCLKLTLCTHSIFSHKHVIHACDQGILTSDWSGKGRSPFLTFPFPELGVLSWNPGPMTYRSACLAPVIPYYRAKSMGGACISVWYVDFS